MNYYIADLHFGHKNIIKYDGRPFLTPDEMDQTLIKNWNNTISDNDTVFILGDISWYNSDKTAEILNGLKGHKVLIWGNHDRMSPKVAQCFDKICDYLEITDGGNKVILCHYPMPFWNGQFRGSIHLYGHVHNTYQDDLMQELINTMNKKQDISMHAFNVGCMMKHMGYKPRTLKEILEANKVKK